MTRLCEIFRARAYPVQLEANYAAIQQELADLQESSDILRAKLVTVSDELGRQVIVVFREALVF